MVISNILCIPLYLYIRGKTYFKGQVQFYHIKKNLDCHI